jgi:hypothetical protein
MPFPRAAACADSRPWPEPSPSPFSRKRPSGRFFCAWKREKRGYTRVFSPPDAQSGASPSSSARAPAPAPILATPRK